MMLCPYCKIRPKFKATCKDPVCQHKHRLAYRRKYFERFERKTGRRISVSITRIKQQAEILATK
jgi:hypothetical protein